jgi:DNA-binding transcriptional MocR family regulator
MTIWTPDIKRHPGPRYRAIAQGIGEAIAAGELGPGARLPPQRDLAWKLGVTLGTVTRAYQLAEAQGLVAGHVGRGTFVRTSGAASAAANGVIDLSKNAPRTQELVAAMGAALRGLAESPAVESLLGYMPPGGSAEHRRLGADFMALAGYKADPERIIVTAGAQLGLAAVLGATASPGVPILAESLTYGGVIGKARLLRLGLHPVAMDAEGMRPDALDKAAHETGAKVVIIVPTIQNPTAATMSAKRRQDIAAVARARDLTIVEDDIYGYLPPERPAPIATLAPERTVYVTGTAKCLAPGLRLGWIEAPAHLVGPINEAVYGMIISPPALPSEILRHWMANGSVARLLDALRRETAARHKLAAPLLDGFRVETDPMALHVFLHLPPPWRADDFAAALRQQGVIVVPASAFALPGVVAPEAVRVSLAGAPDRQALTRALTLVRDLARHAPAARDSVI